MKLLLWGKVIEHLVDVFIDMAGVLVGVLRNIAFRDAAEDQVFGLAIEDINHETADRLVDLGGCCFGTGSPPSVSPSPAAPAPCSAPVTAETGVVGLQFSLIMNVALGEDGGVAAAA